MCLKSWWNGILGEKLGEKLGEELEEEKASEI
jgi:hypothetical protein